MKLSKWNAPVIIWTIIVLYLTWWPQIEIPDIGIEYKDKVAHVAVFCILGLFVSRSRFKNEINRLQKAVKDTMLYCSLFAIFDEAMQGVIPGRAADVWDGLANITGVLIAVIIFRYIWVPIKRRRIN